MNKQAEKLIDAHAHLDDERFDEDLDVVIERAKEAGLKAIVTVGCWQREAGLEKVLAIVRQYRGFVRLAAGVHPHDAKDVTDDTPYEFFSRLAQEENRAGRLVAIGECGLDYHYKNSPEAKQRQVFIDQIKLARNLDLPVIVHSREAESETMEILKGEGVGEAGGLPGVIHCFSGSAKMAEEALSMGLYLSFTGVVTFPKAVELQEIISHIVPIERMMVETDCPYLSPVPKRGKRCESAFVAYTAGKIAELKGLTTDDVARITTLNAEIFFDIKNSGMKKDGEASEAQGEVHEPQEAKIAYKIRNSIYLNITNRCTNKCTFCAKFSSYTVKGHYLRLKKEPEFDEILKAIYAIDPEPELNCDEVVFCGYGESLIRLDLVVKLGLHLKKSGCKIRIDTDGLANLVHGKNVLKELMFVDTLSVSLNAADSATYEKLCRTPYGDKAFPAILYFLREAKKFIPKVVASVVAVPGLDVEACRRIAEQDIGVGFRVREYNEVG